MGVRGGATAPVDFNNSLHGRSTSTQGTAPLSGPLEYASVGEQDHVEAGARESVSRRLYAESHQSGQGRGGTWTQRAESSLTSNAATRAAATQKLFCEKKAQNIVELRGCSHSEAAKAGSKDCSSPEPPGLLLAMRCEGRRRRDAQNEAGRALSVESVQKYAAAVPLLAILSVWRSLPQPPRAHPRLASAASSGSHCCGKLRWVPATAMSELQHSLSGRVLFHLLQERCCLRHLFHVWRLLQGQLRKVRHQVRVRCPRVPTMRVFL